MAIANAMRARGRDVVVVIDSLDAWRLPVRHCGWRGAWPTQLLQLSSWAWCAPGGSVTMVACSQDRDLAARAELDRVIDLERAYLGEPDRRATKLIHPPIRFRGKARLAGAWLGGDPAVRACLRYRPTTSIDGLEQLASVLAVIRLRIAEPYVAGFVDAFVEALRRGHAPLLAEIRAAKQLATDELDALLVTAQAVADQTCRRAP